MTHFFKKTQFLIFIYNFSPSFGALFEIDLFTFSTLSLSLTRSRSRYCLELDRIYLNLFIIIQFIFGKPVLGGGVFRSSTYKLETESLVVYCK